MGKNISFKRTLTILAAILVAGMVLSKIGSPQAQSSEDIRSQLNRFNEVFMYIDRYYVEAPDREKVITGAINGMLSELDPHSVYIPEKRLEKETERFHGSYQGIGIEFIVLNKVLTVVSPITGGPSESVGILPGDQIVRIEGESAYGITEDEVQNKLRGPKGSKVTVTIHRPGQSNTFEVVITRDDIPILSVTAHFMLDDGKTGYIYLGRFARTTSDELEEAMVDLEAKGMEQLVLDLRNNSGGYLEQAVAVADKFIPGGYKIVYTKGRLSSAGEEFTSTTANTHSLYPVIVMIDNGSASASEIVAGAIQDLDRGLVVGDISFGKGLVQNQIPLKDGAALRLTIARYYTPSGRLIQRPYDNGLVDYYTDAHNDSSKAAKIDSSQVFYTIAKRKVYGGGGITPDEFIEAGRITRFTSSLIGKRIFFEFGSNYGSNHREWGKNFDTFRKTFVVNDEMINQLKEIIEKQKLEFNQEAFDKDADYIKLLMKAEVARNLWNSEHYYQVRMENDKQLRTALTMMPEAKEIGELHTWKGHTENKL